MLKLSLCLFTLKDVALQSFSFSRWKSILAITLIGVLTGLDPAMRVGTPEMPGMPLFAAVLVGILSLWVAVPIIVGILKWWMKRGNRWDGQGDLFNLIVASWLIADVLGGGLTALGVPTFMTMPLWLYSVWVGGNALSGAMPKASLGYAFGGIVIALIPAMIVSTLVIGGLVFAVLGAPSAISA